MTYPSNDFDPKAIRLPAWALVIAGCGTFWLFVATQIGR
jgi:hypothetical protein